MLIGHIAARTRSRSALIGIVVAVAVLYLLGAMGRASQKLFWHDEIIALTLASRPLPQLWAGLLDGTDLNPPLYHVTLRWSRALLGEGPVASRATSIAGMALAAVSVGLFVRRRAGAVAGLVAALVLLTTGAYPYAYEARPYAMMLGFVGASLVCWQSATSSRASWWPLMGLLACAAAALALHYYAVLFLAAVAAAEVVRSVRSRQRPWSVWVVLAASLLPLVLLLPLINTARSLSRGYFAPPSLHAVLSAYDFAFSGLLVPFVLALAFIAAALAWLGAAPEPAGADTDPVRPEEWVLGLGLIAAPLLGFVLAAVVTGAFVHRYFLIVTLGFSILAPMVVATLTRTRPWVLALLAGVLLLFVAARDVGSARLLLQPHATVMSVYPSVLRDEQENLPIVVTHGHVFAVLAHYAPPFLTSRAVYVFWPQDLATGSQARYLKGLSRWNPSMRMEPVDDFLRHHRRFLVYGPTPSAFLSEVLRRNGRATLKSIDRDWSLFAVSRPGPCSLFDVILGD